MPNLRNFKKEEIQIVQAVIIIFIILVMLLFACSVKLQKSRNLVAAFDQIVRNEQLCLDQVKIEIRTHETCNPAGAGCGTAVTYILSCDVSGEEIEVK